MRKIHFKKGDTVCKTISHSKKEWGRSLLDICLQHDIPIRHDCGGVCACRTCFVTIPRGAHCLEEMERRESDFLLKFGNVELPVRLACQAILKKCWDDLTIVIPPEIKIG